MAGARGKRRAARAAGAAHTVQARGTVGRAARGEAARRHGGVGSGAAHDRDFLRMSISSSETSRSMRVQQYVGMMHSMKRGPVRIIVFTHGADVLKSELAM